MGEAVAAAALVFIHGLFSTSRVWDSFSRLIAVDREIGDRYDVFLFDYPSPRLVINPWHRVPDFNVIADNLRSYLNDTLAEYDRIVLVGHSQGGLIIQRCLVRALNDGAGYKLAAVRGVVMFACPNSGSDFMMLLRRRILSLSRNRQERDLRPLSDSVFETRRRIMKDILGARILSAHSCPIPFFVYAGQEDNIVTPASALDIFPEVGVLPGDHSSLIRPATPDSRPYRVLKKVLEEALTLPDPPDDRHAGAAIGAAGVPANYVSALTVEGKFDIFLHNEASTRFLLFAGPIDQLSNIDAIAASENTYFQMSQTFKPSTSGRLRNAAALKMAGEIIEDSAADALVSWMSRRRRFGLAVPGGTVVATPPGDLAYRGIQRLYHAAIVEPISGTNSYHVNPSSIPIAVRSVFQQARDDRNAGLKISSICFPLFGAGRGGIKPQASLNLIWDALEQEISSDPHWIIAFISWKPQEVELIRSFLQRKLDRPPRL